MFQWTAVEKQWLQILKTAICTAPEFARYNPAKPTYAIPVAMDLAIEGWVAQAASKIDHIPSPLPITLPGLIIILKANQPELIGHQFNALTDYKSLIYLNTQPKGNQLEARWNKSLQIFDFDIEPGDPPHAQNSLGSGHADHPVPPSLVNTGGGAKGDLGCCKSGSSHSAPNSAAATGTYFPPSSTMTYSWATAEATTSLAPPTTSPTTATKAVNEGNRYDGCDGDLNGSGIGNNGESEVGEPGKQNTVKQLSSLIENTPVQDAFNYIHNNPSAGYHPPTATGLPLGSSRTRILPSLNSVLTWLPMDGTEFRPFMAHLQRSSILLAITYSPPDSANNDIKKVIFGGVATYPGESDALIIDVFVLSIKKVIMRRDASREQPTSASLATPMTHPPGIAPFYSSKAWKPAFRSSHSPSFLSAPSTLLKDLYSHAAVINGTLIQLGLLNSSGNASLTLCPFKSLSFGNEARLTKLTFAKKAMNTIDRWSAVNVAAEPVHVAAPALRNMAPRHEIASVTQCLLPVPNTAKAPVFQLENTTLAPGAVWVVQVAFVNAIQGCYHPKKKWASVVPAPLSPVYSDRTDAAENEDEHNDAIINLAQALDDDLDEIRDLILGVTWKPVYSYKPLQAQVHLNWIPVSVLPDTGSQVLEPTHREGARAVCLPPFRVVVSVTAALPGFDLPNGPRSYQTCGKASSPFRHILTMIKIEDGGSNGEKGARRELRLRGRTAGLIRGAPTSSYAAYPSARSGEVSCRKGPKSNRGNSTGER
ncbi:hypothetical protein BDK51DRAFT_39365 [Blyttiomyces helicus]|uniref:Uncharacterized protein n=1 Tax=Blyttiomyces helicus TaxID=388810 RepID=A0A4P9WK16_9FUNG|nr:hypothetical protein BDK51DRAFT_39365 [Blyttiomyces helicus]|eukprot:RKO92313.1 hypothetical protein BDK51DRAFT_39365 [Blyttiomyces helicus]